jgi:isoquinoline 1-oxidoreductase alpha subunit
MPLLWTLRGDAWHDRRKFGCGLGLCGARSNRRTATRSCITPVSAAAGKRITTIEAIGATPAGKESSAPGSHWTCNADCQSGQIMSASALFE